jgi:hypothetical protein
MTIRVKNKLRLIRPVARCGDTAVDISHLWDVSGMLQGIQTNWSQDKGVRWRVSLRAGNAPRFSLS